METITSEHLTEKDNHTQCECGNQTILEYSWSDDNGNTSCPQCMVAWQGQQIDALRLLAYEVSKHTVKETAALINEKYAEIMGVDIEDFKYNGIDFSKTPTNKN